MIIRPTHLALLFAIGCSSSPKPPTTMPPTQDPPTTTTAPANKDEAVFAAVLLHEIREAGVTKDESICITLRGATAEISTSVIATLKAQHPTTIPDSECQGGGPTGPVTVSATGGKAVRFDVGPIEWASDTQAFITGGGGHRGGGVAERKYTLEKTADGWKVTGEQPGLMT